ncbi:hypothetical protein ACFZAU_30195 [Streptomyces sp. NPDC008238]
MQIGHLKGPLHEVIAGRLARLARLARPEHLHRRLAAAVAHAGGTPAPAYTRGPGLRLVEGGGGAGSGRTRGRTHGRRRA